MYQSRPSRLFIIKACKSLNPFPNIRESLVHLFYCVALSYFLTSKAQTFTDVAVFEKMAIACLTLESTAKFRSDEARQLRTAKGALDWELAIMQGNVHSIVKKVMSLLSNRQNYEDFGIETEFIAMEVSSRDLICSIQDERCKYLWDFICSVVVQHETRNLSFTDGLPRRQTLLLSPKEADVDTFLTELRIDLAVDIALDKIGEDWSQTQHKCSVFRLSSVQQLWRCCDEVGWQLTERLFKLRFYSVRALALSLSFHRFFCYCFQCVPPYVFLAAHDVIYSVVSRRVPTVLQFGFVESMHPTELEIRCQSVVIVGQFY